MKQTLLTSIIVITLAATASAAEVTTVLSGVHNCCPSCEKGILKATEKIRDAKVTPKGGTITIVTKSKSDAKKAVEALRDAGFQGSTDDGESPGKTASASSSNEKKVKSATVCGVHLCCDKCRAAMSDAVKTVAGVTDNTAAAKSTSFKVTGEFSRGELLAAINKAGFAATVK